MQRHLHEVAVSEEQLDQPDRGLDSGDGHQHYSGNRKVEGVNFGADQPLLVTVARCDNQGMAEILDQRLDFVPRQRTPHRGLAILDAARNRVAQFRDDIVSASGREVAANGVQISLDEAHHHSFPVRRRIDAEIAFHSPRSCARIASPSGESR